MKANKPFFGILISEKKIASLRLLVQGAFTLYCIYAGWRFYQFYLWASGRSEHFVPRPPSVEGFLPISALVSLKKLALTGVYATVHPAGLTIFLAAIVIGLLLRKGFCGWICPVGFTSNLAERAGRKMKSLFRVPVWFDIPLLSIKYLLLFFFCYVILLKMPLQAIDAFMETSYNKVVDAKMLMFFLDPSTLSLWVMAFLVVISFFIRNFWCRYLCPYGALLGLLAMAGPVNVRREEKNCIDCGKCDRICPGSIRVSNKKTVRNPECIGCMECVAACPARDCLSLSVPKKKSLPLHILPVAVVLVFLVFFAVAAITGHWDNSMTPEMARELYSIDLSRLAHP